MTTQVHDWFEQRQVWVCSDLRFLETTHAWEALNSVICVERSRTIRGKTTTVKSFYITPLRNTTPEKAGSQVRTHWSIENQQHRHLAVTFAEDRSTTRKDHATRNASTVRKTALMLLQRLPLKLSIAGKRKKAARNDHVLLALIAQMTI